MRLTFNSHAKLNLFLSVLNKRQDNYHNINTVFERIDLCDQITFSLRRDNKIKVFCHHPGLKNPNQNLCHRAAKLLQESSGANKGANINLIKRIPLGSGMGGGSGDAATVLLGLNRLWRLNLARKKLAKLAQKIGSDVPFFIYDCSFAQGEGRGENIKPWKIKGLRFWHILVVPKFKVSTKLIYKKWDACRTFGLTRPAYDVKILKLALRKKDFPLIRKAMFNSLEEVTARLYPQITRIKNKLLKLGVKAILMSGSGPAVFGLVSSGKEARALKRQLKKEARFWQVFVTRTI